jgi:Translation initiation factor IF-2, N-terminal region
MKLNPLPRQKMRVHELAVELGWTSRQLIAELCRRGEYVKSAMSTIEAPVVRDIRRDFATAGDEPEADVTIESEAYGSSAESHAGEGPKETFAAALARIKLESGQKEPASGSPHWRPAILQALLDEVIVPNRPERLGEPRGGYFHWEVKQAEELNRQWAEACLNGLSGDDATIIDWIRLSDGEKPNLAAELSRANIGSHEACLQLGYGGRVDTRWPSIFHRYRDGHLSRSEAIAAVMQWRRNQAAS